MTPAKRKKKEAATAPPVKLDLGCGKNCAPGFEGVDAIDFGQAHVCDLTRSWPFADASVEEARASHLVEHFDAMERVHFANELYRVLVPGGRCTLFVPHWSSCRAYGDLTHKWPPVSEFWFYYLKREWREANAPHNDFYACDFNVTWGYATSPELAARSQEFQQFAINYYKEAVWDIQAQLVKA